MGLVFSHSHIRCSNVVVIDEIKFHQLYSSLGQLVLKEIGR